MNTHKVYTREQLEAMIDEQLDKVYSDLVGYAPIANDGMGRSECIELILEQYDEIEKHKPATIEQPAPVPAHTPGPWSCYHEGTRAVNDTFVHTFIVVTPNTMAHDNSIGIATSVISLAPEMLDVLKYINECTKGKEILNHGNGDEMQITIDFESVKNIGSLLSRARQ